MQRELAEVYGKHYFTFATFICRFCQPSDMDSLKPCCASPSDFKWLKLTVCIRFPNHTVPFHSKYGTAMDFHGHRMKIIDECAPDSAVLFLPNGLHLDVYEEAGLRSNTLVGYNHSGESADEGAFECG